MFPDDLQREGDGSTQASSIMVLFHHCLDTNPRLRPPMPIPLAPTAVSAQMVGEQSGERPLEGCA